MAWTFNLIRLAVCVLCLLGQPTAGFLVDGDTKESTPPSSTYQQPVRCVDVSPQLCAIAKKNHQCNTTFAREHCCWSSCPICSDVEEGCAQVVTAGLCKLPDFAAACCVSCKQNSTDTTTTLGIHIPWDY